MSSFEIDRNEQVKIMCDQPTDSKTLFTSLQAELNSRVLSRVSINIGHMQTITAFSAGFIITRIAHGNYINIYAPHFFLLVIPFISYYFISLYIHNDLQIGFLNKYLNKIESHSAIPVSLRFYDRNKSVGRMSFEARGVSSHAIKWMCVVSPVIFVIDTILNFSYNRDIDPMLSFISTISIIISICMSNVNYLRLSDLDEERKRILDLDL